MTLDALEARYVPKIYRVFEGFICLVTRFAFAVSEAAEVNRDAEQI